MGTDMGKQILFVRKAEGLKTTVRYKKKNENKAQ